MSPEEATELAWKYVRQRVGNVEWTLYAPTEKGQSPRGEEKWIVMINMSTKGRIVDGTLILLVDDETGKVERP